MSVKGIRASRCAHTCAGDARSIVCARPGKLLRNKLSNVLCKQAGSVSVRPSRAGTSQSCQQRGARLAHARQARAAQLRRSRSVRRLLSRKALSKGGRTVAAKRSDDEGCAAAARRRSMDGTDRAVLSSSRTTTATFLRARGPPPRTAAVVQAGPLVPPATWCAELPRHLHSLAEPITSVATARQATLGGA